MKKNIPTHDPQTGDLNPYYEDLTGNPNPLRPRKQNAENIDALITELDKRILQSKKLLNLSNNTPFCLGKIDALMDFREFLIKKYLDL